MPLTDSWLVRWDTVREPRPRLVLGRGPASVGEETKGFVAFQGYLFEREQLAVSPSRPDAALVGAAYERWQQALFDKLRGAFALAVWDEERRCLVVGRDAMGLIPCFYWWESRVLIVSPSLDAILRQPEVDGRFNRFLIAEYIQNVRAYQRLDETFYENIHRLRPAHTLSVQGSVLSLNRYWDPIPPGFGWATEDELSRFTSVLGTAVVRTLSVGADSVALSGGFDSVSIAVVAAERRQGGRPLHAVSLRFTHPSCDEGERQAEVARTLGMPHLMRSVDDCLSEESFVSELWALSRVSPGPVLSAWQPMYVQLLRSAADLGLSRLIAGTGGDEMYQINMGYAADCLAALDLHGLWRFCRACQATWPGAPARVARSVLWEAAVKGHVRRQARSLVETASPSVRNWLLRRRLRNSRPSWLLTTDADLLAQLEQRCITSPTVSMAPREGAYVRDLRMLPQSATLSLELEQSHAWTTSVGFTLLLPYFDRDLVELSLRIRPAELIAGGRPKAPLRRLVSARLPHVAMPSRKILFGQLFDVIFRREGGRAWAKLGGPQMLATLKIVDPDAVNRLMESYFTGRARTALQAWFLVSTELWLRARSEKPYAISAQEDHHARS